VVVSPLLAHCVPTGQDITNLDLRVRNLDNKVLKMHKEVDRVARDASKNTEIDALQAKQADIANRLEQMNMEFLQIKGALDENSHFYKKSRESSKAMRDDIDKRLGDLADQIMLLADQMNGASKEIEEVKKTNDSLRKTLEAQDKRIAAVEERAAMAMAAVEKVKSVSAQAQRHAKVPTIEPSQVKSRYKDGKKSEPPAKTVAKVSAGDDTKASGPGKEAYEKAVSLFRSGKYNQAYRAFNDYIKENPKGRMVPNARFWLGDCYYNQQEYELAILEYQKVLADYARHPKAPVALLKQGLAFEKLRDKATAVIVYKKLMADYPKSEQYAVAQKRVKALK